MNANIINTDNLKKEDISNLKHMLGIGKHIPKKHWGYRNFYAPAKIDIESMTRLENEGLVYKGNTYQTFSDCEIHYYHATLKAGNFLNLSKTVIKRAELK